MAVPPPAARLAALLTLPALWLVVAYLGSLAALLVTSLYTIDDFTTSIIHELSFDNFRSVLTVPVYRDTSSARSWWPRP